jgi:hypothetical protein
MQRRTLDRLLSWLGLTLAVILVVAGSLLVWGHNFISNEVRTQLTDQQIYFPTEANAAAAGLDFAPLSQYAGQQLTTGAQAKTYADHVITVQLKAVGGGKTYAQLSTQARANPTDVRLAATSEAAFKLETARGLLFNAYAFDTMGTLGGIGAVVAFISAALMLLLSALGLWHSRRVASKETGSPGQSERAPADAS